MRRLKLLLASLFLVALVAFTAFSREALAETGLSPTPAAETVVQQDADQATGQAESTSNIPSTDSNNSTQPSQSNSQTSEAAAVNIDSNISQNETTPIPVTESSNSNSTDSSADTGANSQGNADTETTTPTTPEATDTSGSSGQQSTTNQDIAVESTTTNSGSNGSTGSSTNSDSGSSNNGSSSSESNTPITNQDSSPDAAPANAASTPGTTSNTSSNQIAATNNSVNTPANSTTNNTQSATQTPATNATATIKYTVKAGDTLSKIAVQYKTTVAQIKALNKLSGDTIYVGQTLLIPNTQGGIQTQAVATQTVKLRASYTVRKGDTLYLIGKWFGVTASAIQSANGLKSTTINVGQKLIIPLGTRTGTGPFAAKATYYVRSGDTLYLIAQRFGSTVAEIKKANNLTSDRINVGQKLLVPVKTTTVPVSTGGSTGTTTPSPSTITYTVKAGDTLWLIAQRYGVTVAEIKTANKLGSDVIYVGQKLVIPQKSAGTGSGTNTGTNPGSSTGSGTQTYVVQPGDTFEGVAWKFNVSVEALKAANGFGPGRWLMAGETIIIPRPAGSTGDTGVSRGTVNVTRDEYLLLARLVYAEARGEIYEGQVAVAAVVLNRLRHPDFPKTIAGVIYEPWAFTCVNDGQINLTPDQTALNAAQDALNGWDPSGGAIYYWNPATATSSWVWSRTIIKQIGNHVFAI